MIKSDKSSDEFEVTCSYLEVYNEVIYDLLEKSSGHLELREDPDQGIVVAGLQSIKKSGAYIWCRWCNCLLLLAHITTINHSLGLFELHFTIKKTSGNFTVRNFEAPLSRGNSGHFELSSVCLVKMVLNFVEDNNNGDKQKCGRSCCGCFTRSGTKISDEEFEWYKSVFRTRGL